jgi:teichuronic acid biosynthesis glycosyltransferase TuaC
MKVLFVSRGKYIDEPGIIVKNQGDSLCKSGIELSYYIIDGKSFVGYFKNIFKLRKILAHKKFDIIHAHYSLSGMVAAMAGSKPLVVSLMGSDIYLNRIMLLLAKIFCNYVWDFTIVKTSRMKELMKSSNLIVIPNGIDLEKFRIIATETARANIGFIAGKKYIIFIADPARPEKNFKLASKAVEMLHDESVNLYVVSGVLNQEIPFYLNAADVLILTSFWEGSVNVIKEAMACNLPIVSVDTGDVKDILGNTEGCYISSYDPGEFAENLKAALKFGHRTNGRQRIFDLRLDSESTVKKLSQVYAKLVE